MARNAVLLPVFCTALTAHNRSSLHRVKHFTFRSNRYKIIRIQLLSDKTNSLIAKKLKMFSITSTACTLKLLYRNSWPFGRPMPPNIGGLHIKDRLPDGLRWCVKLRGCQGVGVSPSLKGNNGKNEGKRWQLYGKSCHVSPDCQRS